MVLNSVYRNKKRVSNHRARSRLYRRMKVQSLKQRLKHRHQWMLQPRSINSHWQRRKWAKVLRVESHFMTNSARNKWSIKCRFHKLVSEFQTKRMPTNRLKPSRLWIQVELQLKQRQLTSQPRWSKSKRLSHYKSKSSFLGLHYRTSSVKLVKCPTALHSQHLSRTISNRSTKA